MTEEEFLKSKDFMKLGQAITHKNKQVAVLTANRLLKNCTEAGVEGFDKNFTAIRQCIMTTNYIEALNILTLVTAKRVKLLKKYEITEI